MDIDIGNVVLATGALGTAAFGIVEGLKWTRLGEAGFSAALTLFGPLTNALEVAYGGEYESLLRGEYRGDPKELIRVLRQGVRVGLTLDNSDAVARFLGGSFDAKTLKGAVQANDEGMELTAAQRNVIGRFELAADARIDAAITVAQGQYAASARSIAGFVALTIAVVTAWIMQLSMTLAVLVGIAAVPLAPIAKDVASGIQAASKALRAKA